MTFVVLILMTKTPPLHRTDLLAESSNALNSASKKNINMERHGHGVGRNPTCDKNDDKSREKLFAGPVIDSNPRLR